MKEKFLNKRNILIIIFCLIIILVILYKIFSSPSKKNNIDIVKSSSKFYTVSSCISRYLNYLSGNDTDNILLLLDSSFKKNNKINSDNLYKYIDKLNMIYNFEARKMYQEKINNDITKYYVEGYVSFSSDYNDRKDYYIIVFMNTNKMIYSVMPYDGSMFNDGGK